MIDRRRFLQGSSLWAIGPIIGHAACEGVVSQFDEDSTAEEVTLELDLSGKTALVTGINSGIGYETMRVLALRGAHVLGTARTQEKGRVACDSVAGNTTPLVLELSDFDSVVACADRVQAMGVEIPYNLLLMTPYLLTLAVLALFAGRVRTPADLARPFRARE